MPPFFGGRFQRSNNSCGLAKYQTTNKKRPAMNNIKLTSLRILSPRGVSTELVNVRNVSMPL
jgi:ribosomal protein L14E/L6E/L27E